MKKNEKVHNLHARNEKAWGENLPMPQSRFGRVRPIMTCTKRQVGRRSGSSLLPTSAYRPSGKREVCKTTGKSSIPYK